MMVSDSCSQLMFAGPLLYTAAYPQHLRSRLRPHDIFSVHLPRIIRAPAATWVTISEIVLQRSESASIPLRLPHCDDSSAILLSLMLLRGVLQNIDGWLLFWSVQFVFGKTLSASPGSLSWRWFLFLGNVTCGVQSRQRPEALFHWPTELKAWWGRVKSTAQKNHYLFRQRVTHCLVVDVIRVIPLELGWSSTLRLTTIP